MSAFTPSLRLHDRYVLHDRIGLGGMSEVWRADDEVLGRPVAVKVLAGSFAVDPDLRATLRREARAAARLAHPHVTQVYDYGEATLDGGTVVPFLVMELVDGQNLADRLADGPLPWPSALRTAAQVATAPLAAAHRIGDVRSGSGRPGAGAFPAAPAAGRRTGRDRPGPGGRHRHGDRPERRRRRGARSHAQRRAGRAAADLHATPHIGRSPAQRHAVDHPTRAGEHAADRR
ncbi:protein kinase domain-containing protein [Micromonospora craniellae]|uniref:non-specific serine/threonine protein kinase n=1 Tax=Micromonospora craniellae TaxID=2294034 RepID=A0A372G263_9ACTN|nr:hypothetical protein [Micromonospora craniellae]RFS46810.1 hypothetical protein D0Q02_10135 [Micromonospora craniellae]